MRLPASGPAATSSNNAESRTERVIACAADNPIQLSIACGPAGVRPRLGLSPNKPQCEAGIRIEPPPSLACAAGIMPAATAAAAPPDEPPLLCSRFHGLRVMPHNLDSVVAVAPNSGLAVLPKITNPALR